MPRPRTTTPIASQRTGASGTSGPARSRGQQPGDQHPDQEVAEHRIGERTEAVISARLKKQQRDPEPEQHQQVEVQQAQRPPGVEERRHEEQAERDPDYGALTVCATAPS